MTDLERAFLADIAAHPQDDFPRLAYADWLEEHGEESRAEFIRVQVELARFPTFIKNIVTGERLDARCTEAEHWVHCPDQTRCSVLRRRERELLDEWGWAWVPVCLQEISPDKDIESFRRGFVSSITLPCVAFLEHAADIIEAVPMLEEVRLSDVGPMELRFDGGPAVWVFSRASAWPAAFDDAVNLTHDNRENALSVMSRCCKQFAHDQLAARRNFRPGIVAATAH